MDEMDEFTTIATTAMMMVVDQSRKDDLEGCKKIIKELFAAAARPSITVAMLATLGLAFVNKELGGKE